MGAKAGKPKNTQPNHKIRIRLQMLCLAVALGTFGALMVASLAKPTYAVTPAAEHSHDEDAEHAAQDLAGTPISQIEAQTNANKAKIAKQQGAEPGAARAQKSAAGESTLSAAVSADPGVSGQWSSVIDTQVVPIFQAVLPNGKVLTWDSVGDKPVTDYPVQTTTRAMVWNPVDNTFKRVDVAGYNIFCAGFAHLSNGNILVAGGNKDDTQAGIVQTHIFNWQAETWSRGPDMAAGRWYPSVTETANGEEAILGGGPATPEVYQTNGTLRKLSNFNDAQYSGRLYPFMTSRPDGLLSLFGPYDKTYVLSTTGNGAIIGTGTRDGILRDYGSFAPFDIGKVLVVGGGNITEGGVGNVPTKTSQVLSTPLYGETTPSVAASGSLSVGRRQVNATILADGSVLASGGETRIGASAYVNLSAAATSAERWDPATGTWTVLASASRIRQYHSAAVLLPDGRVLTGGGGVCGDCVTVGYLEKNIEYFTPPYLYKKDGSGQLAARPVISNAPGTVAINTNFSVTSPQAASIRKVALVGLSDSTHDVNQGQRYVPLKFTASGTTLTVTGPPTGGTTPPGYYMLFIVDSAGVPSVAATVQVAKGANPVMGPIQNAASGRCVDIPYSSTTNATYMWTFDCNGGNAQAATRLDYDGSIRVLGRCIDVPNSNFVSGQRVWSYNCNGGNAQKWQFNTDGTIRLVAAPGLCLSPTSAANQSQLIIYTCDGGPLQKWSLQYVQPPRPRNSRVQNNGSGRCIDVPYSSTAQATYMWTFDCNGSNAQALTRYDYNSSIQVLGLCLDVSGGNFVSNQRVWTYTCNGTNAQKWQFNTDATIRPVAAPSFCLSPVSAANQSQLIIYTCDNGPLQKWNW